MSYGQMRNGGVTMIDQLPELDDLAMGGNPPQGMPQGMPRGMQQGPPQGMQQGPQPGQGLPPHGAGLPPGTEDKYSKYIRGSHSMNPSSGMNSEHGYGEMVDFEQMQQQQYHPQQFADSRPPPPPVPQHNCIDIAKHVQDCPICSKFYNNDKTVYIIAIVVLAIVCLLLLKRVLDV